MHSTGYFWCDKYYIISDVAVQYCAALQHVVKCLLTTQLYEKNGVRK